MLWQVLKFSSDLLPTKFHMLDYVSILELSLLDPSCVSLFDFVPCFNSVYRQSQSYRSPHGNHDESLWPWGLPFHCSIIRKCWSWTHGKIWYNYFTHSLITFLVFEMIFSMITKSERILVGRNFLFLPNLHVDFLGSTNTTTVFQVFVFWVANLQPSGVLSYFLPFPLWIGHNFLDFQGRSPSISLKLPTRTINIPSTIREWTPRYCLSSFSDGFISALN